MEGSPSAQRQGSQDALSAGGAGTPATGTAPAVNTSAALFDRHIPSARPSSQPKALPPRPAVQRAATVAAPEIHRPTGPALQPASFSSAAHRTGPAAGAASARPALLAAMAPAPASGGARAITSTARPGGVAISVPIPQAQAQVQPRLLQQPPRPLAHPQYDERDYQLQTLERSRVNFEEELINFIPNPVRARARACVRPCACV
jgi:hypothetical protein